jgi:hypothetical protein
MPIPLWWEELDFRYEQSQRIKLGDRYVPEELWDELRRANREKEMSQNG